MAITRPERNTPKPTLRYQKLAVIRNPVTLLRQRLRNGWLATDRSTDVNRQHWQTAESQWAIVAEGLSVGSI